MKVSKTFARAGKVGIISTFFLALTVSPVAAASPLAVYRPGVVVADAFSTLILRPDPQAYWYVEQMGTDASGNANTLREVYCGQQTCVKPVQEGFSKFVRLQKFESPYFNYTNANLSENKDGMDSLGNTQLNPGPWSPSVGHPVVVEATVRFSPNHKDDGTGGASGSAGVWLWNNPFSQGNPNPMSIYTGMGFSWASADSLISGLNATLLSNGFPAYIQHAANAHMDSWNVYTFVWSTDAAGNQTVDYYLNTTKVGSAALPAGVLSTHDLSLEIWNDNQKYTFTGVVTAPVPQSDYFDVNNVVVTKI